MSSDKPLPGIISSNTQLKTGASKTAANPTADKRPRNAIVVALSDPSSSLYTQREVSSTVFDLLLIEMNHSVRDLTRKQLTQLYKQRFRRDPNNFTHSSDDLNGAVQLPGVEEGSDDEPLDHYAQEMLEELELEIQEETCLKMEMIGWKAGVSISEKLTRDRPRFSIQTSLLATANMNTSASSNAQSSTIAASTAMLESSLEVVKFVCKDFWTFVTNKPIDNLKTNHRGVFVLQDNQFKWMNALAPLTQLPADTVEHIKPILSLACGLLRGGLSAMGLDAQVTAEMQYSNQCSFKVELVTAPTTGR